MTTEMKNRQKLCEAQPQPKETADFSRKLLSKEEKNSDVYASEVELSDLFLFRFQKTLEHGKHEDVMSQKENLGWTEQTSFMMLTLLC